MAIIRTLWLLPLLFLVKGMPSLAADPGLKILLTNDDGVNAAGLRALKVAFEEAGHEVTIVAPNLNYSGTSAMLTLLQDLKVTQITEREYSVEGSPATCALLGLTAVFSLEAPPDLLISGINHGANLGPSVSFSGTVGAATMALTLGVPAIAVSSDPMGQNSSDPQYVQHYNRVANFLVRLVEMLRQKNGSRLIPSGTALNINYPPLKPDEIRGVRVTTQGRSSPDFPTFVRKSGDGFEINYKKLKVRDSSDSDTKYYSRGFITVLPFDNDRTGGSPVSDGLEKVLSSLHP